MKIFYYIAKFIARISFEIQRGYRDGFAPEGGEVFKLHEGGVITISKWHMERLKLAASRGNEPKIAAIKLAREIWALSLKDAKELIEDLGDAKHLPEMCSRNFLRSA